ncbi:capsid protein [Crucivirus-168]|nr:capsid protein [Crucivirus-168]
MAPAKKQVRSTVHQRKVRGKGAYNVDASYKRTKKARKVAKRAPDYEPSFGRSLLTEGGSALGGLFGMPGIGKSIGSAVSNVFGLGSYEIKENVFMEGRLPQMMNVPAGGGTVIRFQEYLGDIITSATPGAFSINSWDINAANRESFPFLAQIAANYESYQVMGLIYEFRSTSCDALNSTNTALGSVLLATQYDVADPVFTSKAEMLNYEYSNSVKPSDNCMHMVECAPNQTVLPILYTLDGSIPANTDPRLYHLGRFQCATIGFQSGSVRVGEIHCTYQIRLLKPKLYSALGLDNDYVYYIAPYVNASPLGSAPTTFFNNFGVAITPTTITIPGSSLVKNYRIEVCWQGITAVAIAYPSIAGSGGAQLSNGFLGCQTTAVSQNCAYLINCKTSGDDIPNVITYGVAGTLPTGTNTVQIRIMELPQSI